MVEQVVKDGIVMQGVAVAVEAGVDVVFLAGGEPVAHEFVLQERFAACGGNAAACGAQVVAVGHDCFMTSGTVISWACSVCKSHVSRLWQ